MHPRRIPRIALARTTAVALGCAPQSASSVPEPAPQPAASPGRIITSPRLQTSPARRLSATIIRSPVSHNERPFWPGRCDEETLASSAD
jgi:hypothetical protein